MIKATTTNVAARAQGLKLLCYGPAGAGKTRMCATTPDASRTLILSAEAGVLSLRDYEIPMVVIDSRDTLRSVLMDLVRDGGKTYDWICVDSLSELAEVVLNEEKGKSADGRRAYGEMADAVHGIIRGFRNLSVNVYFTCKQKQSEDNGRLAYGPALPGRQLAENIGYWFDEVFALRLNKGDDNEVHRWLQTANDGQYTAKDRSGSLELFEPPNLADITAKIHAAESAQQKVQP